MAPSTTDGSAPERTAAGLCSQRFAVLAGLGARAAGYPGEQVAEWGSGGVSQKPSGPSGK